MPRRWREEGSPRRNEGLKTDEGFRGGMEDQMKLKKSGVSMCGDFDGVDVLEKL